MNLKKAALGITLATSLLGVSSCTQSAGNQPIEQSIADIDAQPNSDGNYNIVFVTVDQEHYFDEYPAGTNFKARELLEKMGTTFEKHYTCTNVSTSSRSVIYTGTHITDTLMIDNTESPWQEPISENLTTVGDRMLSAGYYSAFKGKWHMGDTSVFDDTSQPAMQEQNGLLGYGFSDWNTQGDIVGQLQQGYMQDSNIAGDTVSWLRSKGLATNAAGQSFFLAVNLVNPHDIMYYNTDSDGVAVQNTGQTTFAIAGAPVNTIYETSYPEAEIPSSWDQAIDAPGRVPAESEYFDLWNRRVGEIPAEASRWENFRDYYYNCIQDNDDQLYNILSELSNLEMLDNTIIVFTSDHGDMQGANGLRGKGGFMYENNIHVPMIIVHPEYEGGNSINAVTSHLDLAPTFIDMTNLPDAKKAELSGELPGISMMDLLDGSQTEIRVGSLFAYEMISMIDSDMMQTTDPATGVTSYTIDYSKRGFVRGITTEKYKFARYFSPLNFNLPTTMEALYANNDVQLFDLEKDPKELVNLAADKETNAALIMELNNQLNALITKEIGVDDGSEATAVINQINKTPN
ncbi:sulfatase-like hydrolase/transferase [Acetobacterium wieringae]|uniref:sulfatase-like hydrolase/transferase n=1 Tax=Acetobacterium wieringae TaxID=52694 RepID=UPI002B1FB500|nr:sulfatase-like hydrolase/transferase [Acetobacterium wieringae]MEA4806469.1 sulfatase-like hydrolase/transferase [Acetobacterium wieringae]